MNCVAIKNIAKELSKGNIEFEFVEGRLHVLLPNNFDTLVIEICKDEEDSITLLNGSFHTHGNIEAREYGLPNREKGIRHLIESIYNGKFKMVRRKSEQGRTENTIFDSLSLVAIDKDLKYEIVSEI